MGQAKGRNTEFLGEYSEEQPEYKTEPTKAEIKDVTAVKGSDKGVQVLAKKAVRKWYGDIEKDRYDINKNLTSFVNQTKTIAKDLSKKIGFKYFRNFNYCVK